jgi:ribonuclease HII
MSTGNKNDSKIKEASSKRKPAIQSNFDIEKHFFAEGYQMVIGIDEVGRGPLAGPVVACAASLRNWEIVNSNWDTKDPNYQLLFANYSKIKDSKLLTEKQREALYDFICEHFHVGIGLCDHHMIDKINILEATHLAMKKALSALAQNVERGASEKNSVPGSTLQVTRKIVLVDGNKKIPQIDIEQRAVIGGDKIVKSISAASIIAKVTRDRMMLLMDQKFPQYGFSKHKGYGTKLHMECLKQFGPCEIHRRSFEPVRIVSGEFVIKKG